MWIVMLMPPLLIISDLLCILLLHLVKEAFQNWFVGELFEVTND
jgi:hypothetical protein